MGYYLLMSNNIKVSRRRRPIICKSHEKVARILASKVPLGCPNNGVAVAEWLERQYTIFVILLSWVRIQFGARQDFSSKKYHYKSIYIYLRACDDMMMFSIIISGVA